jgi:hypothetical protein
MQVLDETGHDSAQPVVATAGHRREHRLRDGVFVDISHCLLPDSSLLAALFGIDLKATVPALPAKIYAL